MTRSSRRNACPICAKAPVADHTPFCSRGCRDRDLLQWLSEGYRIPGPALPEDGLDTVDPRD